MSVRPPPISISILVDTPSVYIMCSWNTRPHCRGSFIAQHNETSLCQLGPWTLWFRAVPPHIAVQYMAWYHYCARPVVVHSTPVNTSVEMVPAHRVWSRIGQCIVSSVPGRTSPSPNCIPSFRRRLSGAVSHVFLHSSLPQLLEDSPLSTKACLWFMRNWCCIWFLVSC